LPRWDEDLMRAPFRPVSRGDLLLFPCAFKRLFGALRRRLLLSRRADDCRLPPLRFECLAKFVRLRIWSKTFGLPRGSCRHLSIAPADGPRKFVELFLQVKNLFLQI
jgi:hypothetical protein